MIDISKYEKVPILAVEDSIKQKVYDIEIDNVHAFHVKNPLSERSFVSHNSAAVCIGNAEDKEYTTMKDYRLHPEELKSHRWSSNNSVFAEVGKTDYSQFVDSLILNGEPGIVWLENAQKYSRFIDAPDWKDSDAKGVNACQPSWAKLLTPEGIKKLSDLSVGDLIWSKEGWTKIVKKWSTGIKLVYRYETSANVFYGTKDHKVVSNGKKIEVGNSESLDVLKGAYSTNYTIDAQDVMDGLVVGGGSVHKASNNLVFLYIGEKDYDYFSSEISSLIIKHRPGLKETAYEIKTTISPEELPKTYERAIPSRFMENPNKSVGFLRGLFSANGSVSGNRVTLKATSKKITEDVQLLLNSLGIKSYFTTNRSSEVKFSNGTYLCKQSYDINITSDREKFISIIGFIQEYKNDSLKITETFEKKVSYPIINIECLGEEEVYEITVDNTSHTYWTQGCDVSNCGEITLCSAEICNLCETFPSLHDSYAEYKETLKYAYLYAKTVTLLSTHWPETNAVILKNRRIGLSQSGIVDAFVKHGRREMLKWSDNGYKYVTELDKMYSDWLCIPRSRKMTTVKPSGSVSLLPGVSPGIHYQHSEYYIRRVRIAKNSSLVKVMEEAGYFVEEDESDKNNTKIISFPVHEKYFNKKKEEVSMWEQIKNVVDYQRFWADNNVSVTITFKPEEKEDIVRVLECYEDSLKTVSFLPLSDHNYDQAPYETITKEKYLEMSKNLKKPDFSKLIEANEAAGEKFCSNEGCSL